MKPEHHEEEAYDAASEDDDEGYGIIAAAGPQTRSEKPATAPPFECPVCKSMIAAKNATRHMLDQHKNSPALNNYESCAYCGGLFIRHKLTPHVHKMHPGEATGLAARGKPPGRPDRSLKHNPEGGKASGGKPGKGSKGKPRGKSGR